jgi:hypothetical protein
MIITSEIFKIVSDLHYSKLVNDFSEKLNKANHANTTKEFVIGYVMYRIIYLLLIGDELGINKPVDYAINSVLEELEDSVRQVNVLSMTEKDIDKFRDSLNKMISDDF